MKSEELIDISYKIEFLSLEELKELKKLLELRYDYQVLRNNIFIDGDKK